MAARAFHIVVWNNGNVGMARSRSAEGHSVKLHLYDFNKSTDLKRGTDQRRKFQCERRIDEGSLLSGESTHEINIIRKGGKEEDEKGGRKTFPRLLLPRSLNPFSPPIVRTYVEDEIVRVFHPLDSGEIVGVKCASITKCLLHAA